ncbi:MAG: hypothetical protein ACKO34_04290 [Vampirovibrionales bacterium]
MCAMFGEQQQQQQQQQGFGGQQQQRQQAPRPNQALPTRNNPNEGKFEKFLGNQYANEVRQMQAMGVFNRTSHALQPPDYTLGHLVTQGINNLATISMKMRQVVPTSVPVPVTVNEQGQAEVQRYGAYQQHGNYRYSK